MRPKERIPIFLEKVNFDALQERWDTDISQDLRNMIFAPIVRKYWKKNYATEASNMIFNYLY